MPFLLRKSKKPKEKARRVRRIPSRNPRGYGEIAEKFLRGRTGKDTDSPFKKDTRLRSSCIRLSLHVTDVLILFGDVPI
jgi:hypothetical protein